MRVVLITAFERRATWFVRIIFMDKKRFYPVYILWFRKKKKYWQAFIMIREYNIYHVYFEVFAKAKRH